MTNSQRRGHEAFAPQRHRTQPRAPLNAWAINVLLVDDDKADASLVLNVLRRHAKVCSAIVIETAESALLQLATGKLRPDLILLDVQMPKVDGFKFLAAMDEIPGARLTPVVMLTTSRYARDVERAREGMANGYIVKPDSIEELRSRLDATIERAISGKWS